MNAALSHRGPDGAGTWCDREAGVALGHTRLSIIDLSAAAGQPMAGPGGKTRIVFNGEIYNYVELRESLAREGAVFRTTSDTEVILALYERYGAGCIDRLRGMFAFAIWDCGKRSLLLARDRLGKKPLYYSQGRGRLLFASELRALRAVMDPSDAATDQDSLSRYLSLGFVPGPATIYKGVTQLEPGSLIEAASPDRLAVRRYWRPPLAKGRTTSLPEAADEADRLLAEAVRIRLRADVPVGVFLSGGIDSGLVAAAACEAAGKPCATFTAGFGDGALDERPLAALVARRYGTVHREVEVRPDLEALLPKMAMAYGQPFADPSAVPTYCIAEAVRREGFKVVLNGDGGDELFGGYRRYLSAAWFDRLAGLIGKKGVGRLSAAFVSLFPSPRAQRGAYGFMHRFARGAALEGADRLIAWSNDGFTEAEKKALGYKDASAEASGRGGTGPPGGPSALDEMMALDLEQELPYDLLVKMDIATMAHGLEGRSPLLDHVVAEWALSLPMAVKLPGVKTKPILRELARRRLPEEVANAPKRGFEPPLLKWVTEDLNGMAFDLLLSRDGVIAEVFSREKAEGFLRQRPEASRSRWASLVWRLLMLAAWDRFACKNGK